MNKCIILFIPVLFLIFRFFKINVIEQFRKKRYTLFQHNPIIVNKKTFKYTLEVKKQLLRNVTNLLHKLKIKYVIGHGNLLEFTRNRYIYHDDDIDIRMDIKDKDKWFNYCTSINSIEDEEFHIKFDNRIFNIDKQLYDGIQVNLLKFNNCNNIKEYNIDIHCDLVFNRVNNKKIWIDYNIDYNNIRRVKYIGSRVYAPSKNDTKKILIKDYGNNYMIPIRKNYIID